MANKIKILFRLALLLIVCSYFIIPSYIAATSDKDLNIPIYIQSSAGIEKASSKTIEDVLFNYNFIIEKKTEVIPDEKCSLRADGGNLNINEISFSNGQLSFEIPLKNDGSGKGSLTAQKDRTRFSLSFDVTNILETNSEKLVFSANGKWRINTGSQNSGKIIVTFDKINNKVSIAGTGDNSPEIKDMDVTFLEGCLSQETSFYLITTDGKLANPRTIEEVKELLKQHPELIDAYEGLRDPEQANANVTIIPEFNTVIGILTLLGAVGVFFFIRKK